MPRPAQARSPARLSWTSGFQRTSWPDSVDARAIIHIWNPHEANAPCYACLQDAETLEALRQSESIDACEPASWLEDDPQLVPPAFVSTAA